MSSGLIFRLALWFGALSGMIEGALYLWFQYMHWLTWSEALVSVGPDQVWISTLVNLALFLIVATALAAASRIIRWKYWPAAIAFVFAWMALFDFIALPGRLRATGAAALAAGVAFQCARWFVRHQERIIPLLRRTTPVMLAASAAICVSIPTWSFVEEKIEMSRLPAPATGARNVVLIVMDTVRADHLSAYGYPRATSPNIDALAAGGVLFENAYATSPWTLPSHVSMFTGQYPFQHGQSPRRNFSALGMQQLRLATVMRDHGYATAGFVSNTIWGSPWAGLPQGFTHYESLYGNFPDKVFRTFYGRKFKKYGLLRWMKIDRLTRNTASSLIGSFFKWLPRAADRPFFVFFNFMEAHEPTLARPSCAGKFTGASSELPATAQLPAAVRLERENQVGGYDNAICSLDEEIASLLKTLESQGRLKNTLVIITSDHGEMLGEHGIFDHGNSLYEQVLRVPLIMSMPAQLPRATRVEVPVSHVDLSATILDVARVPQRDALAGRSLAGLWRQNPEGVQTSPVLAEVSHAPFAETPDNWPVKKGWLMAMRDAQWKLIVHQDGRRELYDLQKDPGELRNLAEVKEFEEVGMQLLQKMAAMVPEVRVLQAAKEKH